MKIKIGGKAGKIIAVVLIVLAAVFLAIFLGKTMLHKLSPGPVQVPDDTPIVADMEEIETVEETTVNEQDVSTSLKLVSYNEKDQTLSLYTAAGKSLKGVSLKDNPQSIVGGLVQDKNSKNIFYYLDSKTKTIYSLDGENGFERKTLVKLDDSFGENGLNLYDAVLEGSNTYLALGNDGLVKIGADKKLSKIPAKSEDIKLVDIKGSSMIAAGDKKIILFKDGKEIKNIDIEKPSTGIMMLEDKALVINNFGKDLNNSIALFLNKETGNVDKLIQLNGKDSEIAGVIGESLYIAQDKSLKEISLSSMNPLNDFSMPNKNLLVAGDGIYIQRVGNKFSYFKLDNLKNQIGEMTLEGDKIFSF